MITTDTLIVGCGCAGLYCALKLPKDQKITILTKADTESSDSYLAQGGICVQHDDNDFDSFYEDTMKAGHHENDPKSVELMIQYSRDVVDDLIGYGVRFNRLEDGSLDYTREGAHSKPRILYHQDITGKEITSHLLARVRELDNVTILEYTTLIDLVVRDGSCCGGIIRQKDGKLDAIHAKQTVLATGGIGGLFTHSTNFHHLTGDALAMSLKHGIKLKNIDYIQIHPTTFYDKDGDGRSFLISESVRGEGAKLYDKNMERFADELMPRDRLTKAIHKQMEKDGTEFVWEDLRTIPHDQLHEHFPNIVAYCAEKGYDVDKECIPVVPAQHYFMGGVEINHSSQTSMPQLYAVGETACNGVHGRNRLASNSLLESLVFAGFAAQHITAHTVPETDMPSIDWTAYEDSDALEAQYKKLVLDAIHEEEKKHV